MNAKSYIITSILLLLIILTGGFFFFFYEPPSDRNITYKPQQTQLYLIDESKNDLLNILVTTLPEFSLKLIDQKFKNIWQADAAERKSLVSTNMRNAKGDAVLSVKTDYDEKNKQIAFTPLTENKVKPGMYKLDVTIKTVNGENVTITQDFSWGVLALNTNKAKYQVGEQVKIGMAVLDDFGRTKCIVENVMKLNTARVWLTVTSPSGQVKKYSTDDKSITGSSECADRNYTNKPDFSASTEATEPGRYTVLMESETLRGKRQIQDSFLVLNSLPEFEIERTSFPTRIYPRFFYPVVVRVTSHKDYSGKIYDTVPKNFTISHVSDYGRVVDRGEFQTIEWQVNWKKEDSHILQYTIKFPPITPEFYVIGPLKIGDFSEGRGWQVASDSLFALVQEAHNTATTGSSLVATFAASATPGNLLILICARDQNSTINTPSGYTRRYRYFSNSPRLYHFDRIVPASPTITTGTCSFSSNGSIATTFLEFSGNSSSGYFDKIAGPTRSTNCNTGAHQSVGSNITPTNPDELLVSGFVSTAGNLTVTSHNAITGASSTGFTDTETSAGQGFSDANASYASGWGEAVNNPATVQHDTATFSGAATACTQGVVAYNAAITLSQGGFRFFDNADSVTPGGTLAAEDTAITLNQPNYPFRLRILLDVDSPSGTTLGVDSADLILQYAILPTSGNCADVTTWAQVTNSVAANDPPIAFNPNASVTEGSNISATGSDPSDNAPYTTVLQSYYGDDNNAGTPPDISNHQNTLGNNQAGLWDLSLIDNTDDSSSQTYCLRIADSSGADLSAYNQYPKVTTIITDVTIRGGSNILGGTNIR